MGSAEPGVGSTVITVVLAAGAGQRIMRAETECGESRAERRTVPCRGESAVTGQHSPALGIQVGPALSEHGQSEFLDNLNSFGDHTPISVC